MDNRAGGGFDRWGTSGAVQRPESRLHLNGRGAETAVLLQHAFDQRVQRLGNLGIEPRGGHDRGVGDRLQRRQGGVGFERMAPGEVLVQHDPQREDVGGAFGRQSVRLLGRHVTHGAQKRSGLGVPFGLRRLAGKDREAAGEAEIEDLHVAVRTDHQVLGLDVPVDDPFGVGCGEGPGRLSENPRGLLDLRRAVHQRVQGRAVDQLHHDEWPAFVLPQGVDRADVGMVERRGGPRLAEEPLQPDVVAGVFRRQELQRDLPVELRIARSIDNPHAPPAQLPQHFITGHGRRAALRQLHRRAAAQRKSGPQTRDPGIEREVPFQSCVELRKPEAVFLQRRRLACRLPQRDFRQHQFEEVVGAFQLGMQPQVRFDRDPLPALPALDEVRTEPVADRVRIAAGQLARSQAVRRKCRPLVHSGIPPSGAPPSAGR